VWIEKSAITLGGFAKTDALNPGASETLTITYDTNEMASYSGENGYFILENGTYDIMVARNVHDITFNETYELSTTVEITEDLVTGTTITNLFDEVAGDYSYMSRTDFDGTYPETPSGRMTSTVAV